MTAPSPFVCVACRSPLQTSIEYLACGSCGETYPVREGIADFSRGSYYDQFSSPAELTPQHVLGLELEKEGTRWRMQRYYLPALERDFGTSTLRVLDSGCGNGVGVAFLTDHGVEAWGNDVSQLRRWQWQAMDVRHRLIVASSAKLPFPAGYFDAVITSGVIEHIGVDETGGTEYHVRPRATRDAERSAYLVELLRVTRAGGSIYVDCPNGRFPIDFWHSTRAGGARLHRLSEGFLPSAVEIRTLAQSVSPGARVIPLNPENRFRFEQVGAHWYGRLFRPAVTILFLLMRWFKSLRTSPVNPYLVLRIVKR